MPVTSLPHEWRMSSLDFCFMQSTSLFHAKSNNELDHLWMVKTASDLEIVLELEQIENGIWD
jgi:hypothetical protein